MVKKEPIERVKNDLGLDSFTPDIVVDGKCIAGTGIDKSGKKKVCAAIYDKNDKLKHSICVNKPE